MKINKKLYTRVTTEPISIQEHDNCMIEVHSMNGNERIYDEYSRQGKFVLWSSLDGKTYRLIAEDGYFSRCKDLYAPRVNKVWIKFWQDVDAGRKKIFYWWFFPFVLLTSIALIIVMVAFPSETRDYQAFILIGVLAVYLLASIFMNRRLDRMIKVHNSDAIKEIKGIIGQKKFNNLMEVQRSYYDEFFATPASSEPVNDDQQDEEEIVEEENENEQIH